ncbi:MAG: hypothetical protein HYT47_02015 [Candidatus Vogelbacteria bacterium]|nr:hypothetical protein [Candidatus Vogelbacteria bacterium]
METLTIPKKLAKKGDLVLIPRRDYERLLAGSNNFSSVVKPKRRLSELDKRLGEALEEVRQGKVYGPFDNVNDLMRSLRRFKKSR